MTAWSFQPKRFRSRAARLVDFQVPRFRLGPRLALGDGRMAGHQAQTLPPGAETVAAEDPGDRADRQGDLSPAEPPELGRAPLRVEARTSQTEGDHPYEMRRPFGIRGFSRSRRSRSLSTPKR